MDNLRPDGPRDSPTRLALAVWALLILVAAGGAVWLQGKKAESRQGVAPLRDAEQGLETLQRVAPELLQWRLIRTLQLGLEKPRGIALRPTGELAAVGVDGVEIRGPGGELRWKSASPDRLRCVAADPEGGMWVAGGGQVHSLDAQGRLKLSWPALGHRTHITCLATESASAVWVADAGNRIVLKCAPDGRVLQRFGQRDTQRGVPGLLVPSPHLDVVPLPSGGALITNPGRLSVETYAGSGALKSSWGKSGAGIEGFSGCCNPTDLAVLPDGHIVTSEKGLPRVKVYRPDGKLESVVAAPEVWRDRAAGIDLATDAQGHVYALDPVARTVMVFERVSSAAQSTGDNVGR